MFNKDEIEKAKLVPWDRITKVNGTMSICPFHEDKTESMSVKFSSAHCFVCQRNWDKIQFVMERDTLTFKDAVKLLVGLFSQQRLCLSGLVKDDNFIFDESGGWQMKEPNVSGWFIPDCFKEEFKELKRINLCQGINYASQER